MRRIFRGIGLVLLATAAAVGIWFWAQRAGAGPKRPLSQADIEARAVVYARKNGLQGAPTRLVSKQMTRAEFSARLDPFSQDPAGAATLVWLVALTGDFVVAGPPRADGTAVLTRYDNAWLLLSAEGEVMGRGHQAPGFGLDLSAPVTPLPAWPTPANPKN